MSKPRARPLTARHLARQMEKVERVLADLGERSLRARLAAELEHGRRQVGFGLHALRHVLVSLQIDEGAGGPAAVVPAPENPK